FAGEVKIVWTAIESVSSAEPVNVMLKSGETVRGAIVSPTGDTGPESAPPGAVTAPLDTIAAIRNDPSQAAFNEQQRKLQHPKFTDFWNADADAGLNLTRGNANSLSFSVAGKAVRAAPHNKLTLSAQSIFSKNTVLGVDTTTAKAIRGGVRDDIDLGDRW